MTWTSDQPIIAIADVHKSFGEVEVLKGLSFDVAKGEVICIIGPSGSGKSTLLRCINALIPINKGSIKVEGQEVHDPELDQLALRRKVGMVFQQFNLFPHKTAIENVMMAPVHVLKQDKAVVEEQAHRLMAKVRLQDKEQSYPGELSGGQQQRVAIARAVIARPRLLLADEPTGNVDDRMAMRLIHLFEELNRLGTTVVIATHNENLVRRLKHPCLHLEEGRLEQRDLDQGVGARPRWIQEVPSE